MLQFNHAFPGGKPTGRVSYQVILKMHDWFWCNMEPHKTSKRKNDHIQINLNKNVQHPYTTGLENIHFIHNALPEINLDEVLLDIEIFSKKLSAPILISSMTGGTQEAGEINRILAETAQETRIAIAVGSQRAAIENPELRSTFEIRKYAPDVLLFSNLGAIQLNYGYGLEQCKRAVDMIQADGLILHLNPLQEALQPEGNVNFKNLLSHIEKICHSLDIPVIVKEVGWGISPKVARRLINAGVSAIDVAGAGGTSWSQVEKYRAKDSVSAEIAASFYEWGLSTADSLLGLHELKDQVLLFASGGIRNGVDIAKCIALGAVLGGMAGPFLHAAANSLAACVNLVEKIKKEIRICMFATGTQTIQDLKNADYKITTLPSSKV